MTSVRIIPDFGGISLDWLASQSSAKHHQSQILRTIFENHTKNSPKNDHACLGRIKAESITETTDKNVEKPPAP